MIYLFIITGPHNDKLIVSNQVMFLNISHTKVGFCANESGQLIHNKYYLLQVREIHVQSISSFRK